MKTTLRSLSSLLLIFAAATVVLGAALPQGPNAGKFLVLRNGHTMEGDIERIDDQYRVRRNGGDTWVPAPLVLRLFLDTEDAYKFLLTKTKLDDADERLRLAQWCFDVNLRDHALEQAQAAEKLRPRDADTKRLLERLSQPLTPAVPVTIASTMPMPEPESSSVLALDLTPEALGLFTHKVQPILINACASCHASGRGGSFRLMKPSDSVTLNRKVVQENLVAVLGQLNRVQPQASPLLTKAVTIHGGIEQAPLKSRQAVAYHALEDWVRETLANNPQLLERLSVAPVPPPAPTPEAKAQFADGKTDVSRTVESPRVNVVPIAPVPIPVKVEELEDDAYGATEFNRQAHPERYTSPAPNR